MFLRVLLGDHARRQPILAISGCLRSLEVCPGRKWKTFRRRSSTHRLRRHRWLMLAGYIHVTSVFLWWFVVHKLEFFGAELQYATRILIDQQITVHRMARAGAAGIQHIVASSFRQRLEQLTSGADMSTRASLVPIPGQQPTESAQVMHVFLDFRLAFAISCRSSCCGHEGCLSCTRRGGAGSHIQEHSQGSPAKHRAWRGEQTRPMDATSSTRTLARKRALRRARNRGTE